MFVSSMPSRGANVAVVTGRGLLRVSVAGKRNCSIVESNCCSCWECHTGSWGPGAGRVLCTCLKYAMPRRSGPVHEYRYVVFWTDNRRPHVPTVVCGGPNVHKFAWCQEI